MLFQNTFIPYGAYWSTPFCRWQGSFANLHPLKFAAEIAKRGLTERGIEARQLAALHLGTTIPSVGSFYGAPWVASLMEAPELTGPTLAQACATSARLIASAACQLELGDEGAILALAADRTSNGPHLVYPSPRSPGGRPQADDWVWNNFNCDPATSKGMLETAERVASEEGISRQEQDELTLLRFEQYRAALEENSSFLKRYLITPIEVPVSPREKASVEQDEGVYPTSAEKLARLKPVLSDGTVTFGGQTYPADGNAGLVLAGRERARELSFQPDLTVQVIAYAEGRVPAAQMPKAPVPAARRLLEKAGLKVSDVTAIKTHNPFAVNDVYFSRALGIPISEFNNYGSSLIWGHPQAPTGLRLLIELIEELRVRGGGYGLFSGCAAGDTAAAVLVRVD